MTLPRRALGMQVLAGALAMVGCAVAPEVNTKDETGEEPIDEAQEAFQNSLSYVNCGEAQKSTIQSFATFLSDRIYESGGDSMRRCLNDSFLSYANNTDWGGDVWYEFNRTGTTKITCASSLQTACAGGYDWWGCASIGISGEAVTLSNSMINDPNVSTAEKAALLAHELTHNYGHRHPNGSDGDGEYFWTVTERARSCVRNRNALPVGESRTNGMPGEVELGYVGRFGGTPFEFSSTGTQFLSGLTVYANATINGLVARFSDSSNNAIWSAQAGTASGVNNSRMCNAGDVVVGVSGRARSIVNQLRVTCAPRSNLNATYTLGTDGNGSGSLVDFDTRCPAGKAVRQVRGRAGSSIDQIRLVCDDIGANYGQDHAPAKEGPMYGRASGKLFSLRCSGNGAFSSFVGRSGSMVDRLGGMCTATGGTLPITPRGPVHPAIPWLGGTGGSAFTNTCAAGELMVGVNVRSGGGIDAVGPICANASQWDANASTPTHDLALNGGGGGTLSRQMCPAFHFLVGLELWGGSIVNGLQIVCADMR